MDKSQKIILAVISAILAAALTVLFVLAAQRHAKTGEFTPPPFEDAAEEGTPVVSDESLRYAHVLVTSELVVGLCATCAIEDESLLLYFASLEHNTAWVRAKVYDERGKLCGESGLLRPGEYVERIALSSKPRGKTLVVKVLSYEPDTYYSLGTAELTVNVK